MTDVSQKPPKNRNWPRDVFGWSEVNSWFQILWLPLLVVLLYVLAGSLSLRTHLIAKRKLSTSSLREVIAYCAQDQAYAEPIFRDFEKETGIKVRPVYDSEAVKTVALASRLLAERNHPQCDVFWGNEEMRTRQLAARGVFRETNGWRR